MRCSQPQGLPVEAIEFLDKNAVKINQCQHCHRHDGYQKEAIGTHGMFDELSLYRYTLSDGRTADEYIQHTVWSSGPMEWLGLRWGSATFEWTKEELDEGEGS